MRPGIGGADERIAYGATCTWWGTIHEVGSTGSGLPGCPQCGGVLFECATEAEWWSGARRYAREKRDPAYPDFLRWLRGRCYRWTANELAEMRNRGERPGVPIAKARAIFDADYKRDEPPTPPIVERLRRGNARRAQSVPGPAHDDAPQRRARRKAAKRSRRRNR